MQHAFLIGGINVPRKFKFTKEEIIAAAFELARESGLESVTARAVAARLDSSSKVIFGSFKNMDDLHEEVIKAAEKFSWEQMQSAMEEGKYPAYKASGMAYIEFARKEPRLFELLYMRKRFSDQASDEEDRQKCQPIVELIQKNTGLSAENAYMLHLDMWFVVHGIAVLVATSYLRWDEEFFSKALTDTYFGLRHRFCEEVQKNGSHPDPESDKKV